MVRTVRVLLAAVCFLVLAALLFAQSPATHRSQAAAATSPSVPPAPTDLQKAQLENIQLKMMLLAPERRQQLQQQYGALVQQIQGEHPGYIWNPQTSSLMPAPKPAHSAEKAK